MKLVSDVQSIHSKLSGLLLQTIDTLPVPENILSILIVTQHCRLSTSATFLHYYARFYDACAWL